jgi:hypothetical protein
LCAKKGFIFVFNANKTIFMKYLIVFLLFLILIPAAWSQRQTDIGLFGGCSYYMGEINPTKQFYKPSPSFGGFFRWNINKRFAGRLSGYYLTLKADPSDFPDRLYPYRPTESFSNSMMDFSAQVEFNFVPYITGEDQFLNSVYIAGGIGYAATLSSNNSLTIPFGVGFKINLTDRLSTGLEWSFRKTFVDDLDHVTNPLDNTLFNNNDWYSVLGLFISYKFVKFAADCPVYK